MAENLCKEEQELGRGGGREEGGESEKEPPPSASSSAFDDLLSGGDALAAFSNKCSSLLPFPVCLSHLQFLLGLSALAIGVAVWCVLYFFAF